MNRKTVSIEAVKRFALRSTISSAEIERRVVPAGYVRSEKTQRFLAQRQPRF